MAGTIMQATRLTIRQLLVTTTAIAIALWLATAGTVPISFRLLGLAFGFYCSAICIFAVSSSLVSPKQEILFLAGLPLYLFGIVCGVLGCLVLAKSFWSPLFYQSGA